MGNAAVPIPPPPTEAGEDAVLRAVLDALPAAVLHVRADGTVGFANGPLDRLLGAEGPWAGRPLEELPGLGPSLAERVRAVREGRVAPEPADLALRRPDGAVRTLTARVAPDGCGAAVVLFDVTEERERVHGVLRRFEEAEGALRNAALTHASEHAFLDAAVAILGGAAEADRAYLLLPAEGAAAYEEELRWAREPERSLVPLRLEGEAAAALDGIAPGRLALLRASRRTGALLDLLGVPEALAFAFSARGGGGFLVLARDEHRARWRPAERRALAPLAGLLETLWGWTRAEARYREVVGTIEDGLVAFGFEPDGTRAYTLVTRQVEALTGYSTTDLLAGRIAWERDVVHPDDRAAVETHQRALREGRESRLAYRVVRPDGAVRWLRESATPGRDPGGRRTVAGILSDVTEQKEAEASLLQAKQDAEAANRMKSVFLATMSHELRTPLGAIKGFAELLEEEVAGLDVPAEVVEFAQVIRSNAARVLRLVSDLLDLAKLQTDRLVLERAPVPVVPVVRAVAGRYAAALAARGVALALPDPASEAIALADARRLEQVLDILLDNAVKFTERGEVAVDVGGEAETVALTVRDTGVGIAEAYLPHLFEPFSQEDHRLNRDYGGSGLGLALASRLMAAMGGTIEVRSAKGQGSAFTLRLPRANG